MRFFVFFAVFAAFSGGSASAQCRPYEAAYPNNQIVFERAKEMITLYAMPDSKKPGLSDGAIFGDQEREGAPDPKDPLALTVYAYRQAGFADYGNATFFVEEASRQLATANLCVADRLAVLNRLLRKYIAEQTIGDTSNPIVRAHQNYPATQTRWEMGIQWGNFRSVICFLSKVNADLDVPTFELNECR